MNGSSPEARTGVWLCGSTEIVANAPPQWMTDAEKHRFSLLSEARCRDFVASRWLIRSALGAASGHEAHGCQPAGVRPDHSARPPGWRLSVSHSGGVVGCAISRGTPVGIDIEPVYRRPQWQKVVTRWFSPQEQSWLLAANDPQMFLQVWTLKEAWLKATGRGIADNLQTLRVSESFELFGDDRDTPWVASLGRSITHVIAVVHQGFSVPAAFSVEDHFDPNTFGEQRPALDTVDWLFHKPIHSSPD